VKIPKIDSDYFDEVGMASIWNGSYTRIDGSVVEGPSIRDYARAKSSEAAARADAAFQATGEKMQVLKDTADSGKMAYDQMIGPDNPEGNRIVQDVVDGLVAQARAVEGVVSALGLSIQLEGSDSLDNPTAVIQ
jgi:putative iron-regulated protein